jgi:hypothetical protein
VLVPGQALWSPLSVSAPPSPHRLPSHSQAAGDDGFGLTFPNPLDGLTPASFQGTKISLTTLLGNHAPASHKPRANIKLSMQNSLSAGLEALRQAEGGPAVERGNHG